MQKEIECTCAVEYDDEGYPMASSCKLCDSKEITDSQWATSFLANAYTEKQFRDFSEDMSDITRELVSKLEDVRKKERERIIEMIKNKKSIGKPIEGAEERQWGYNYAIEDIIKTINQQNYE